MYIFCGRLGKRADGRLVYAHFIPLNSTQNLLAWTNKQINKQESKTTKHEIATKSMCVCVCICTDLLMKRIHFDATKPVSRRSLYSTILYTIYIYKIYNNSWNFLLLFYNVNILDFHYDMFRFVIFAR